MPIDNPDGRTKEFFIPTTWGSNPITWGDHGGYKVQGAAEYAHMDFFVPHDFSSIIDAVVVWGARSGPATFRLNFGSDYCAIGETVTLHSETLADVDTVVVLNTFYEQDISGILSVLVAGDHVGIKVTGDAVNGPNCQILGVRFKYN